MLRRAARASCIACMPVFLLFLFCRLRSVLGGGCTGMLEGGSSKAGPASSSSKVPLQLAISRAAAMVLFTSFH